MRTESEYITECDTCGERFETFHGYDEHSSEKGHSGYTLLHLDGTPVESQ